MKSKWIIPYLMAVVCCTLIWSCQGNNIRPEVRYLDRESVRVSIGQESYVLRCNDKDNPPVPFKYIFEDDCEIKIWYKGRVYDFDSPYDIADDIMKQVKRKRKTKQVKRSLIRSGKRPIKRSFNSKRRR